MTIPQKVVNFKNTVPCPKERLENKRRVLAPAVLIVMAVGFSFWEMCVHFAQISFQIFPSKPAANDFE